MAGTPIAFVSEHSETLVELDIEYGKLARVEGVAEYHRIRTLGIHPEFINGLVRMVLSFAGAPEMKNRPDFITSDIPCDCLPLAS